MTRRIVCAANCSPLVDHHVILGVRHFDEQMRTHMGLYRFAGYVDGVYNFSEQGFLDNHGIFCTRQEAWKIAQVAGQIIRRVGGDDADGGTLYSENIY